jgi:hypothetical protein
VMFWFGVLAGMALLVNTVEFLARMRERWEREAS